MLQKCVTALDTNWHPDHFFCAHCGKQFGQEGFHEKDGKPYCRTDYLALFAPKCGGCSKPITDNYITALNAQWHPECFVCRVSFYFVFIFLLSLLSPNSIDCNQNHITPLEFLYINSLI